MQIKITSIFGLALIILFPIALFSNVFIENKGQWEDDILYAAQIKNLNVLVSESGVIYDFYTKTKNDNGIGAQVKGHVVKMNVSSKAVLPEVNYRSAKFNYLHGQDRAKWITGAASADGILFDGVAKGIKMRLLFEEDYPRYDFIVQPGASADEITFDFEGAEVVADKDRLIFRTQIGDIYNGRIIAYQTINGIKREVECCFTENNGGFGFNVGSYDKSQDLIIDPLVYCSYFGGGGEDEIMDVVSLDEFNYIVCGWTESMDFNTTPGAYDEITTNDRECFITKYNIDGAETSVVFSTLLGGEASDQANSIDVDYYGNIYICGQTNSSGFPVYPEIGNSYKEKADAFITKFNTEGDQIIYSWYIGGVGDDIATAVSVDSEDEPYIVGYTTSTDIITKSAYQTTNKGQTDIFACKLDKSGNFFDYVTYLGGSGIDRAFDCDTDNEGNLYIGGETSSNNFPIYPYRTWWNQVLEKPYDYSQNGGYDGIAVKLTRYGNLLDYSTYFGGTADDRITNVVIGDDGSTYIGGETAKEAYTPTFPVDDFGYSNQHSGGWDCFFAKLDKIKAGERYGKDQILFFCTFFGGSNDDFLTDMELNPASGTMIMVGRTRSQNYPIVSLQGNSIHGNYDAFHTEFTNSGSDITFSFLYGGNAEDGANALAVDSKGGSIEVGYTKSLNFSMSDNANNSTFIGGTQDGYYAKFVHGVLIFDPVSPVKFCAGSKLMFRWNAEELGDNALFDIQMKRESDDTWNTIVSQINGTTAPWDVPFDLEEGDDYLFRIAHTSGMFEQLDQKYTLTNPPYLVSMSVEYSDGTAEFSPEETKNFTTCETNDFTITAEAVGQNATYQWYLNDNPIPDATSPELVLTSVTPANNGNYTIKVKNECTYQDVNEPITLNVTPATKIEEHTDSLTLYENENAYLSVTATGDALTYLWKKDDQIIYGKNEATLTIQSVNQAAEGMYKCVVSGTCGIDSTNEIKLVVDTVVSAEWFTIDQSSELKIINGMTDNDIIIILESEINTSGEINLLDNFGRKVSVIYIGTIREGQNQFMLNSSVIPSGLYWISAEYASKVVVKKLLIVN